MNIDYEKRLIEKFGTAFADAFLDYYRAIRKKEESDNLRLSDDIEEYQPPIPQKRNYLVIREVGIINKHSIHINRFLDRVERVIIPPESKWVTVIPDKGLLEVNELEQAHRTFFDDKTHTMVFHREVYRLLDDDDEAADLHKIITDYYQVLNLAAGTNGKRSFYQGEEILDINVEE